MFANKLQKYVSKSKIYVIIFYKERLWYTMGTEMTIQEVQKKLNDDNIEETILLKRKDKNDVIIMNLEEYKKMFKTN